MKDKIQRKYLTVSSASVLVLLFIFFCPLPWGTSIPFVVEPTESRIIYSQNPGYIEKITANNYSQVKKDQILIVMGNKLLKNELNRKEVDLKIAEEELEQALTSSETLAQANVKREEIVAIKDKIEQIRVKLDTLTIHSPINGEYMYNDKSVQESSWIGKGYSLGEVFSPDNFYVLAFATEDNIKHIKEKDTASLSFNNVLGSETGRVSDINTAAEKVWPYNPLLSVSGGPIEVIKKDERGEYITRNYYYPIKISINNKDKGLLGKTGVATIYSYRSIGMGVIKKGINIFYQEFSI